MKLNSTFALARAIALSASLCVFAGGCAHWSATPRLEQAGAPGYRVGEVIRAGQARRPNKGRTAIRTESFICTAPFNLGAEVTNA